MRKYLHVPFSKEEADTLTAGDYVYLTGTVYTARDAAHKRMQDTIDEGKKLPFDVEGMAHKRMQETLQKGEALPIELQDAIIYYMGPSPAREGRPIGSAGPTTASRMDKYAPTLLDMGLRGMIGKGKRTPQVLDAVVRNHAVYFAAVGGAGAILSKCICSSEVIAYDDLGTEAIRKLEVKDFPVIVVADAKGNNLYATATEQWCRISR